MSPGPNHLDQRDELLRELGINQGVERGLSEADVALGRIRGLTEIAERTAADLAKQGELHTGKEGAALSLGQSNDVAHDASQKGSTPDMRNFSENRPAAARHMPDLNSEKALREAIGWLREQHAAPCGDSTCDSSYCFAALILKEKLDGLSASDAPKSAPPSIPASPAGSSASRAAEPAPGFLEAARLMSKPDNSAAALSGSDDPLCRCGHPRSEHREFKNEIASVRDFCYACYADKANRLELCLNWRPASPIPAASVPSQPGSADELSEQELRELAAGRGLAIAHNRIARLARYALRLKAERDAIEKIVRQFEDSLNASQSRALAAERSLRELEAERDAWKHGAESAMECIKEISDGIVGASAKGKSPDV